MIYDRIDLIPIGTWAKGFRPQGLLLSFGTNLFGGDVYTSLTDTILPYGTVIDSIVKSREDLVNYTVSTTLPYCYGTAVLTAFTGAFNMGGKMGFSPNTVFTEITFPAGVFSLNKLIDVGTSQVINVGDGDGVTFSGEFKFDTTALLNDYSMPFGVIVTAYNPEIADASSITLSATNYGKFGVLATGGVKFSAGTVLTGVRIPYGTNFTAALTIDGVAYAKGIFKVPAAYQFQMNTTQLVTTAGTAIFSVHGIDSDELITFARPTVDIGRLIMYKDGVGVACDTFACYKIEFKLLVTALDIKNFNLLHPSDVNPVIIDDGSMLGLKYIIP